MVLLDTQLRGDLELHYSSQQHLSLLPQELLSKLALVQEAIL